MDALTRLELQALLLKISAQSGLTVVLVTGDVDEAVFMSSRVAMLSRRPAVVDSIIETELPRPRDAVATVELPRFLNLRHRLLDTLLHREPVGADA